MTEINPTKQRLADMLKVLMEKMPFEKISVTLICDRCGMNRKSFYYHFEDKYDLLNWIFDTEIFSLMQNLTDEISKNDRLEIFSAIYAHFRQDKHFYQQVLCLEGHNSFSELLWAGARSVLEIRLKQLDVKSAEDPFILDMITDVAVSLVERAILDENDMSIEDFSDKILRLSKLVHEINFAAELLPD